MWWFSWIFSGFVDLGLGLRIRIRIGIGFVHHGGTEGHGGRRKEGWNLTECLFCPLAFDRTPCFSVSPW